MNLKVLIVDDDEVFIMVNTMMVKRSTIADDPVGFDSGKKALEYIEKNKDVDETILIFLDINMPVMSGWEFLESLKNKNYSKEIYIVILTSSIDLSDHIKAKSYKLVIDFVEKILTLDACLRLKRMHQLAKFY
ncbi:MAG: response regulator [Bacteroidetes bacterium]|nr:response regulator [Bacteroidota bacterium]